MLQVFGTSEMVGSTFQTHNSLKEEHESFSNRCCAHPSVTTAGLLLLLVRFTCTKHRTHGMLCQDGARGQAVVLLKSLLSEMDPLSMTVDMTKNYQWHHPRPDASELVTAEQVQLKVDGGYVDVSDLIRLGSGPGKNACCTIPLQAHVCLMFPV